MSERIESATLTETSRLTVFPAHPDCALATPVRRFTAESPTADKSEAIARARADGIMVWEGRATVSKFRGASIDPSDLYEVVEGTPNVLTYGGASLLWERATGATGLPALSNANAYIGVGDTNTAATATQTDLAAPSNKAYLAMDSTYPIHTDGTTSPGASIQFRGTAATGTANWAWAEWGIFNASSSGRMLNRKVEALGTKTSASTWQLLITLSLL
jgi:hypothetical protein